MGQSKRDKRWPQPRLTRHVWVRLSTAPGHAPAQGVVVSWRRHAHAWSAYVVVVIAEGEVVQQWVPAERLGPVRADPNAAFDPDRRVMRSLRRRSATESREHQTGE